jgi:hypothetical protein
MVFLLKVGVVGTVCNVHYTRTPAKVNAKFRDKGSSVTLLNLAPR